MTRAQGSKSRDGSADFAPWGTLPTLFCQTPANQFALELGQVIDEELAFEVIHFMLDADRQQSLRVHLERLAVAAQRAHANMRGARQFVVDAGQRQTPLFRGSGSLRLQQFW